MKEVFKQISKNVYEIFPQERMRVAARFYASKQMLTHGLVDENALIQLKNVATLPGIQKYSLAMPDIHWGYGFPIGGIAAFDLEEGIVSPGGVGYDINCGVRIAKTTLHQADIQSKLPQIVHNLFKTIPTGLGSRSSIEYLSKKDFENICRKGAEWAISKGFGTEEDLENTEDFGCMKGGTISAVSGRAMERGRVEMGTLGSGNHFLEIDRVDEIMETELARKLGLFSGQVLIQIHTGSRGFGHQICQDYLKKMTVVSQNYHIELPDKQLACVPIHSRIGRNYLQAMTVAANFAFANRQIIMRLAEKALSQTLALSKEELGFNLLYDVAHNIAKFEYLPIGKYHKEVLVHRKGATRAYGPGSSLLNGWLKEIGQPVLIPGDMGRYSYIAVGTKKAEEETFASSSHGAGRVKSRKQAIRDAGNKSVSQLMSPWQTIVQAKGKKTIAEEMPDAYKDVSEVVTVMENENITRLVCRLKPMGVIKG